MAENSNNPYDINGQHFNPDMYFQKLLKVSTFPNIYYFLYLFNNIK